MAGDPMGLSTAGGLQGGWDAFNQILARQELEKQRQLALEQQQFQNQVMLGDRELRERDFQSRERDRSQDNARLDRAEQTQTELRKQQIKDKEEAAKQAAAVQERLNQIANDPNADPNLRQAAAAKLLGTTLPAETYRDRDAEHKRQLDLVHAREDRRDQRMLTALDRRDQAKAPKDDPKNPRGLQDYMVKLGGKYSNLKDAVAELQRAWPEIRAAHPNADPEQAVMTLKRQYEQPAGARRSSLNLDAAVSAATNK